MQGSFSPGRLQFFLTSLSSIFFWGFKQKWVKANGLARIGLSIVLPTRFWYKYTNFAVTYALGTYPIARLTMKILVSGYFRISSTSCRRRGNIWPGPRTFCGWKGWSNWTAMRILQDLSEPDCFRCRFNRKVFAVFVFVIFSQ